ncbi:hypothetical protein Tco_0489674 [Tanacetum coccineum]
MSSPNHPTSDLEDAFSSMNILNYTSVSSDYFPASSESSSFNSSEDSKDNMIQPIIRLQRSGWGQKDRLPLLITEFSNLEQSLRKSKAVPSKSGRSLGCHLPAQNQQTLRIVIALS